MHNEKFIPANPELEQIIPSEFRDEINQLLIDFSSLEDKDFWDKYNLMELWYTVNDYQMDKNDKHIIGNIIINHLVSLEYILQLDYKEDIEDYVDNMKNYWKDSEIKLIRFELDNCSFISDLNKIINHFIIFFKILSFIYLLPIFISFIKIIFQIQP